MTIQRGRAGRLPDDAVGSAAVLGAYFVAESLTTEREYENGTPPKPDYEHHYRSMLLYKLIEEIYSEAYQRGYDAGVMTMVFEVERKK